jgi:ubiquinone/menaquinone biosynthesis C-methylase UbiE
VLEIGCGTGAVARRLANWPGVGETVGLDPSPVFIAHAEKLSDAYDNLNFHQGCAHQPHFPDDSFDVVVVHTTLCHLSDPQNALLQAYRLLRSGGWLAVFDGDYASTSFGTGDLVSVQPNHLYAAGDAMRCCRLMRRGGNGKETRAGILARAC